MIVRENRTYDQVFGSDPRGDGDPARQLFDDNGVQGPTGGITPNAHALTRRFPLLDHVYANSEVSVDGHLITAGSIANDYVQQATAQNYSRPGKSYDFGIAPVTFGPNFFLFDQAVRQGISFSNYGEEAAGAAPMGADGRDDLRGGDRQLELRLSRAGADRVPGAPGTGRQPGQLLPGLGQRGDNGHEHRRDQPREHLQRAVQPAGGGGKGPRSTTWWSPTTTRTARRRTPTRRRR